MVVTQRLQHTERGDLNNFIMSNISLELLEKSELQAEIIKEVGRVNLLNKKKVMRLEDVAECLGLSKATIYKMVHLKQIPYYKSQGGKLTYFDREDIEKWALSQRVASVEEIQAEAENYCLNKKKGGAK